MPSQTCNGPVQTHAPPGAVLIAPNQTHDFHGASGSVELVNNTGSALVTVNTIQTQLQAPYSLMSQPLNTVTNQGPASILIWLN